MSGTSVLARRLRYIGKNWLQEVIGGQTQFPRQPFGLAAIGDALAEFDKRDEALVDADVGIFAEFLLRQFAMAAGKFDAKHGSASF
jgi:hypothetical protein